MYSMPWKQQNQCAVVQLHFQAGVCFQLHPFANMTLRNSHLYKLWVRKSIGQ